MTTIEPNLDVDRTRVLRTEALILTHNAPAALQRCLSAIGSQTRPPTAILVLDNASDPPVDLARTDVGIAIRVLRSQTNLGPAGGWAMALEHFLGDSYDWAWVMDDDIIPEPDCLERLQDRAYAETGPAFVFPYSKQPDGTLGDWSAWSGFVIAKEIVEKVGVPRAELFWWAEDTEYCKWRIPNAGFPGVMVPDALVHHDAIRQGGGVPTWKYYYETRNLIYLHLHIMRRLGWFPRNFARLMARAFLREKGGHLKRSLAIAAAIYDGIVGRLGIRYPVVPMIEQSARQETGAQFSGQ
jgi:rhamnopyranosyl-N-acetylglucosaminyl-diphospho-decaprenol beta-1,3/1,4-galactofuranosyltransferase